MVPLNYEKMIDLIVFFKEVRNDLYNTVSKDTFLKILKKL